MIKQTALSFVFLFIVAVTHAQKDKQWHTVDVTKVTFLDPGIAHEFSLSREQTIMLRTGITATFKDGTFSSGLHFRAFASASARHYYNFKARKKNEKYIGRNSANYVAILFWGVSSPFNKSPGFDLGFGQVLYPEQNNAGMHVGAVWGLQRNFRGRFSLDFNIGVGYGKMGLDKGFAIPGEFTLGMWLGPKHGERKKKKRGGEWYE